MDSVDNEKKEFIEQPKNLSRTELFLQLNQRIKDVNREVPIRHDQDNVLEVYHLIKYFPIKTGVFTHVTGFVQAVDRVSFNIKKGTTMGLVGESGCGKTTTGRTIIRLYNATGGEVYFKGKRIVAGDLQYKKELSEIAEKLKGASEDEAERLKAKQAEIKAEWKKAKNDHKHADRKLVTKIQMIYQDPVASLDPRMTVREIIAEGLKIQGVKDKAYLSRSTRCWIRWALCMSMLRGIRMSSPAARGRESELPVLLS